MKNSSRQKFLLSVFWWLFWIDKFYEWNFKLWLIKLFTVWWYWIWWIIDIILAYKQLENKEAKNISKNILKPIWYIFWGFIVLIIFLVIVTPDVPDSQIIENTKVEDQKEELSLNEKKDIYYIYWQSEHIASWLTFEKYWDWWTQDERDEFFKNTKLEYEQKLTSEKWIDFEKYNKYALELWYWEWEEKKWNKPNSESKDVIEYVYTKEKLQKIEYDKNIATAFKELQTSDNSWMQCSMLISGDGYLSRFTYARFERIWNDKVNVYTNFNWKNAFWQKVKQSVICKYQINDFWRYEIYDIEL